MVVRLCYLYYLYCYIAIFCSMVGWIHTNIEGWENNHVLPLIKIPPCFSIAGEQNLFPLLEKTRLFLIYSFISILSPNLTLTLHSTIGTYYEGFPHTPAPLHFAAGGCATKIRQLNQSVLRLLKHKACKTQGLAVLLSLRSCQGISHPPHGWIGIMGSAIARCRVSGKSVDLRHNRNWPNPVLPFTSNVTLAMYLILHFFIWDTQSTNIQKVKGEECLLYSRYSINVY